MQTTVQTPLKPMKIELTLHKSIFIINSDRPESISFGCGNDAPNNLEIDNPTDTFNITVRHYQPSKRVVKDGYRIVPFMKEVTNEK